MGYDGICLKKSTYNYGNYSESSDNVFSFYPVEFEHFVGRSNSCVVGSWEYSV